MENDRPPSTEEQAFLAHIIDDPADELRRLVFADWLDEHGQGHRATYIRARCALDGKRPEFGTYADAIEQLAACRYQRPSVVHHRGFSLSARQTYRIDWWDDSDDTMEGGLPSFASVDFATEPGADDAQTLADRLLRLVETTTIRGLKLGDDAPVYAAMLFASPAASAITRLELQHLHKGDGVCPAVAALVASPVVRTLTRLDLYFGVPNRATADALAAAPLDALRRFEARGRCFTPEVYRPLMAAPWFGRLERLVTPVPPGTVGRVALPYLHTLGIDSPRDGLVETFGRSAELPALRRLTFDRCDLRRGRATPLLALRCNELVELRLGYAEVRPAELKVLLAAPWASRLEVLVLEKYGSTIRFEKVIDQSPCLKTLRIRRT